MLNKIKSAVATAVGINHEEASVAVSQIAPVLEPLSVEEPQSIDQQTLTARMTMVQS